MGRIAEFALPQVEGLGNTTARSPIAIGHERCRPQLPFVLRQAPSAPSSVVLGHEMQTQECGLTYKAVVDSFEQLLERLHLLFNVTDNELQIHCKYSTIV
jgi:hypothetical protein